MRLPLLILLFVSVFSTANALPSLRDYQSIMVVAGGIFTGLGAFSGVYVWLPHHRTVDITPPPSGVSDNFSKAIAKWQPPLSHMEVPPTPARKEQNETDSFTVLASSRALCADIQVSSGGEEMPNLDHPLATREVGANPPSFPTRPSILGLEPTILFGGCLGLILFGFTYQVLILGCGFDDWVYSQFQYLLAGISWFVRVRICGLFQKREYVFKSELVALRREIRKLNSPRYRVAQEGRRLRTLRRMRYVQAQVVHREVAREFKGHNAHWHTTFHNQMESLRKQLKDYAKLIEEVQAMSTTATNQESQLTSQIHRLLQLEKNLDKVMDRVTVAMPKCRESSADLDHFVHRINRLVQVADSVGKTVRGAENAIISLQGIASRLQEPDISDKIKWARNEADEIEKVIYRGRSAMVQATSWEKANLQFDPLNADAAMAKDAPPLPIHLFQVLRSFMADKEQPSMQPQSADRPVSPLEGPGPVGPSTKRQRVECSPLSAHPPRVIAQPRQRGRRSTPARAPVSVPRSPAPMVEQRAPEPEPTLSVLEPERAPEPEPTLAVPEPELEPVPTLAVPESERAPKLEPEPTLAVPEPERAPELEPEPTLAVSEPERAPELEPGPTLAVPEPERAPEPEPSLVVPEPELAVPVPESVPEPTPSTRIAGLTLLVPGPMPAPPAPAPVLTLRAPVTMQSLSGHMPAFTLPAHIPANARLLRCQGIVPSPTPPPTARSNRPAPAQPAPASASDAMEATVPSITLPAHIPANAGLLRSQGIVPFPTRPPPARPNRPAPAQPAPATDAMEDTVPLDLANNYKEESMVDVPATAASAPTDAMEDTVPLDLNNNSKEESMVDVPATVAHAPPGPAIEDAVPLLLSPRTTPMIDAPPRPEPMPLTVPAAVPVAAKSTEKAATKAPSVPRAAPVRTPRLNHDVVQAILMAEPVPTPPPNRPKKMPISRLKHLKGKGKSWANSNSSVASASAANLAAALAPSGPSGDPLAGAPIISAPVTTSVPAPVTTSVPAPVATREPAPAAPPKSPDRVSKLLADGNADLNELLLADRSDAESNDEVDPAADYTSDWDGVEDRGGQEEDPEEEARAARWDAHQAHLVELSRKRQGLDVESDAEVAEEKVKEDSSSDEDSETDSEEDKGWQPHYGDDYDSDYPSGSDQDA